MFPAQSLKIQFRKAKVSNGNLWEGVRKVAKSKKCLVLFEWPFITIDMTLRKLIIKAFPMI